MGQTFVETKLSGNVSIGIQRRQNSDGTLTRSGHVIFTILDGAGDPIKTYERNLLTFLTPAQVANLNNLVDAVIGRIMTQFGVIDS